jgi:hypothetical protein
MRTRVRTRRRKRRYDKQRFNTLLMPLTLEEIVTQLTYPHSSERYSTRNGPRRST